MAQRPASIVVDLTAVGFLDSTGLRCLIVGKRDATVAGMSLSVRGAHCVVHQVLNISGVLAALGEEPASAAAETSKAPARAKTAGFLARQRRLAGY
jgi:anti-anti-sigma factor